MKIYRFAVVLSILASLSCAPATTPPVDPEWKAELEEWRTEREAGLMEPDGWLALVGLHWLEPGANTVGGVETADVPLPSDAAPPEVATLLLAEDGTVTLEPVEGAGLEVDGRPALRGFLTSDADGKPDIMTLGRLRFYLIDRDGAIGVRVKDPEAPTRKGFQGLEWYPPDPAYRIEATFEPYDTPKEIPIPTVLGTESMSPSPGLLRFEIDGVEHTLEPVARSTNEPLFVIFRDATSADTTYGAGRFLMTPPPADGTVVLDFNRAYNPPCAYTPYATCPLPPPSNWLPVPIAAGEKYSGDAH
jgi:uncharacterized protein (DUF1684 family)